MMEKDPSLRQSAEVILSQQREKLFPEYFYSFLQSYMLMFSTAPILSSDEKISRFDVKGKTLLISSI
jgi:phosphoinositide-3-kinase, regulatory subunit 4